MSGNVFRPAVDGACSGMRLDQFLAMKIPDLSRGEARKVIDLGGVHIDGRRVRKSSQPVSDGVRIEVYLDGQGYDIFSLEEKHILFRDPYILAVDKPPGINTQPTPARYKGTLYDALLRYLACGVGRGQKPSIGMVQRLDRDTSGVIVFSIHQRAHKGLTGNFAGRHVQKIYLALVAGCPDKKQGEFRSLLARQRRTNLMKTVERGGKEALTRYSVLENFGDAALVEIEIPTGRSHQIRVHFAEAGHPLLGDGRYGGPKSWRNVEVPRQILHAWKLGFEHPVTRESLALKAPIPGDFAQLLHGAGCNCADL